MELDLGQTSRELLHLVRCANSDSAVPARDEPARPGVYAVGDVRSGSMTMVAAAVGEGGMAADLLRNTSRGVRKLVEVCLRCRVGGRTKPLLFDPENQTLI